MASIYWYEKSYIYSRFDVFNFAFIQVYRRLVELMVVSDLRFLTSVLATLFDLLVWFDKINNMSVRDGYEPGTYGAFFSPIDRLSHLLNHPSQDIASAAEKVEDLLIRLASRNSAAMYG
jgi:hypothetical protein